MHKTKLDFTTLVYYGYEKNKKKKKKKRFLKIIGLIK